jgi:two-component system, LytTR family, response regulator
MNVVLIDDEASARNAISSLIHIHFPWIQILATAANIEDGYEAIIKFKPDLLLLDIELPDGTGFDLLQKVKHIPIKVIFITGHDEYALDAIKVSALDYVLKPIDSDEFRQALVKAGEIINHEEQLLKLQALHENIQNRKVLKRIILPTFDHLHFIAVSDIIRAEADSNYTIFILSGGNRIMVSRTIKEFDGLLSGSGMIRIHQSHLVNIQYIDRFYKKDGGYIQLKDGTTLPVSPMLKKQVLKALSDHLYD